MSRCTTAVYNPAAYDGNDKQMKKAGGLGAKLKACCGLGLMVGLAFNANGAYIDCKVCHLDPTPDSGAPDYFEYFAEPKRQHPVGVAYPLAPGQDYNLPMALDGDITFFDANGNGIADLDEIQLFGLSRKIECSSCHREHGTSTPPPQPNMYLRLSNALDALCRVCHRI